MFRDLCNIFCLISEQTNKIIIKLLRKFVTRFYGLTKYLVRILMVREAGEYFVFVGKLVSDKQIFAIIAR